MIEEIPFAKKIEDELSGQGIKFVGTAALQMFMAAIRPIATITEVTYRSNMGERYFTRKSLVLGLLLSLATVLSPSLLAYGTGVFDWHPVDQVGLLLVTAWCLSFFVCGIDQLIQVRKRYENGIPWHSYSCGTLPDTVSDHRFTWGGWYFVVCGIILWLLGVRGLGALFVVSGFLSTRLRKAEMARFHTMILDAVDSQINAANLNAALAQQTGAAANQGLTAPLPVFIGPTYREKVLRASTATTPRNGKQNASQEASHV